ncbi:MAG: hypothetical protein ACLGG0_01120 [Bacteriovoracia bacterium]
MRLIQILLLVCLTSTVFAKDEIWLRTTATFKYKKIRFRPEQQHRMTVDGKLKSNVYRLSMVKKLKPVRLIGAIGSFNRYKKDPETRLSFGLSQKYHRLVYEQRFIEDETKSRMRYRTRVKLIKHIAVYQEVFYEPKLDQLNEWRLGATISKNFGDIEGLFRLSVIMESEKEPTDVLLFGLNYKL